VLGVNVRRPAPGSLPTRSSAAFRRRTVVGVLVLLSILLVTLSFRETDSGPIGSFQGAGAAVLRPFEVAATRVARPFRDAYGWFDSLFNARSEAKRLRAENERLRQQLIQNESSASELADLKALLRFKEGKGFPGDYDGLGASVIARPPGAFAQAIVISRGSSDGVEKDAPVVTAQGLIGLVTRVFAHSARVTLLTDESSAVSARDVRTAASGVVEHGQSGSTLVFQYVPKEDDIRAGDTIVTAGWRSSKLASLYPKGIPIARVTSVGQSDTDLYKQVQLQPFADFTSIDAVLVLVPKGRSGP
jgi:rod shape-determining protein MreC